MKKAKISAALTVFAALTVLCGCQPNSEPVIQHETVLQHQTVTQIETTAAQAPTEGTTAAPITQAPTAYVVRNAHSDPDDVYDATGFVSVTDVIPDAVTDIRYYSGHNFVGTRINGYEEPLALLSEETALALKNAADDFRKAGCLIKIFDAYRPQRAVAHFASWAEDAEDAKMKQEFYPSVDKSALFDLGYIAAYSGHSRGSKVDMTLVNAQTGEELDMGGSFDYFDESSHPSFGGVTEAQYQNRMLLHDVMLANGFDSCATEWWDFTLSDEPYPNTYFDFPVSSTVLTY